MGRSGPVEKFLPAVPLLNKKPVSGSTWKRLGQEPQRLGSLVNTSLRR